LCLACDGISQQASRSAFGRKPNAVVPRPPPIHNRGKVRFIGIFIPAAQLTFAQMQGIGTGYTPAALPAPPPVTILRDGYIAHTFSIFTELFFHSILKTSPQSANVHFSISGWPNSFALPYNTVPHLRSNIVDSYGQPYLLLDFLVVPSHGPVVPQTLWVPRSSRDLAQYVLEAELQLPIFFLRNNGGVGLSLTDASVGNSSALVGCSQPVNVGGRTSVHLRMQVRLYLA
jgi:hypothetical protein